MRFLNLLSGYATLTRPTTRLPLPLGEGWGEGGMVNE